MYISSYTAISKRYTIYMHRISIQFLVWANQNVLKYIIDITSI